MAGMEDDAKPRKKRAGDYHHGDLRRALIDQALRTIDQEGVDGLTLRAVGSELGVSRTALYRHFADKQALVAAVAAEGFRTLRLALADTWNRQGHTLAGLEAMGLAYVEFARAHQSHYRVMFGRFVESNDATLLEEAACAFQTLADALADLQTQGLARRDDLLLQARFVWSVVHGVAMLIINGQLHRHDQTGEQLTQYAVERIQAAVAVTR